MCFITAAAASAALPAVLGTAGAGAKAFGSFEGGEATQSASNYAAQVAANNAAIARQNANYAEEAGNSQASMVALKGAATSGKIKTGQAASGVNVNTGSAATVQQSQRVLSKLDTEQTLSNAELQAYGYRTQATNFEAQSGLDVAEGKQAMEGGEIGAGGDLLSGAPGRSIRSRAVATRLRIRDLLDPGHPRLQRRLAWRHLLKERNERREPRNGGVARRVGCG
jgi:hypothetical protein